MSLLDLSECSGLVVEAHALGLRLPGVAQVQIANGTLTLQQIERLEREPHLPEFVHRHPVEGIGLNAYRIDVRGLYWATYRLMENVIANAASMNHAEAEIAKGTWIP